jgi:[acyl-carrier-protein] S-malonyltransferase
MKLAFLFPGQGSQSVGMLDSLASEPAVAALIAQADAALGEPLSALIANGPAEALGLTVNTQPAMLLAGLACHRAWQAAGGPEPVAVAGHSLGEYTALTAAGCFEVDDALRLVRLRAQAMQDAVPVGSGGMAALLGLDDDQVRAACRQATESLAGQACSVPGVAEVVEPANFNAPSQVVIAGSRLAVERIPIAEPRVPLVNNVDVAVQTDPAAIVDALVRQSFSPVRWVEVVRRLEAMGVTRVVEFGPGKVLTGLVKRIAPGLQAASVSDAASLASALKELA